MASKFRAELADGKTERLAEFRREAGTALEIGGENGVDAAKPGDLSGGIDFFEVGLLGGVGPDNLRPEGLITRGVVGLTFFDAPENLVESGARGGRARSGRRFRGGMGSGKMSFFLSGQRAAEGGDRKIVKDFAFALGGELGVGESLDAGIEAVKEEVDGKIEFFLARVEEQPVLILQAGTAVTGSIDDEIGLEVGTVAEDATEPVGLEATTLPGRLETAV